MKPSVITCIVALCMAGFNSFAQKKVEYAFPAEMAPEIREQYEKMCDKGLILYRLNCAKCHTTFQRKKEIIPDFSYEQMDGYAVRISNPQHEMALPEEQVTPEELALIATFLNYKKRNDEKKK